MSLVPACEPGGNEDIIAHIVPNVPQEQGYRDASITELMEGTGLEIGTGAPAGVVGAHRTHDLQHHTCNRYHTRRCR
jgi:hypothetical protein